MKEKIELSQEEKDFFGINDEEFFSIKPDFTIYSSSLKFDEENGMWSANSSELAMDESIEDIEVVNEDNGEQFIFSLIGSDKTDNDEWLFSVYKCNELEFPLFIYKD